MIPGYGWAPRVVAHAPNAQPASPPRVHTVAHGALCRPSARGRPLEQALDLYSQPEVSPRDASPALGRGNLSPRQCPWIPPCTPGGHRFPGMPTAPPTPGGGMPGTAVPCSRATSRGVPNKNLRRLLADDDEFGSPKVGAVFGHRAANIPVVVCDGGWHSDMFPTPVRTDRGVVLSARSDGKTRVL